MAGVEVHTAPGMQAVDKHSDLCVLEMLNA